MQRILYAKGRACQFMPPMRSSGAPTRIMCSPYMQNQARQQPTIRFQTSSMSTRPSTHNSKFHSKNEQTNRWSTMNLIWLLAATTGLVASGLAMTKTQLVMAEPSQQEDQQSSASQEESKAPAKLEDSQEEEQEEELIGGVFRALTAKNAAQILGEQRTRRIIYLYKDKEGIGQITQFGMQLQRSMQVEPLLLDCGNEADMEAVMNFFLQFNPKIVPQIAKEIPEKSFLLMNKFNDIWFWPMQLMEAIYQHQIEILSYFKGPDLLISEAQLVLYQSGDNDIHVVSYCGDLSQQSEQDKLKKFRQFNNNSEHMAGHYKFWLLEDPLVAQTLGIDTSRPTGDIYIVRPANRAFNTARSNVNVFGFEFTSERHMTGDEVQANPDEAIKSLQELSFNAPMIVHDEIKLRKLLLGLPTLLIYCDPNVHGKETYAQVLAAVSDARKKMPLKVSYSTGKDDSADAIPEVMFVVSTTNKLPPIGILKKDRPQALFVHMGQGSQVDVLKEYLPAIERIEGLTVEEFKEKAKNADKEFAVAPGDDQDTQHEKQHQGIVYNEGRFQMQKVNAEKDINALKNSDALLKFVNESLSGARPHHWLSENIKKEKHSVKVVGDSFKARVFDTKRDAIVLVYHPIAHKNRGLKQKFEAFAQNVDQSQLLVARYNGINESSVFKNPVKLPAILHFTRCAEDVGEDGVADAPFGKTTSLIKEVTEYQFTRNHMLKSSTDDEFKKAMRDFITEQTPKASSYFKQEK